MDGALSMKDCPGILEDASAKLSAALRLLLAQQKMELEQLDI
jgi:hypothetical protein